MLRSFLRRLFQVLLGLLLGLLAAEGILRLYLDVLPAPPHAAYLPDPQAGYRLRPEPIEGDSARAFFHVNSLGFRDREHPPAKPEGVRRVLGIGDSFVLGEVPPYQNFLRVAEALLDAAPSAGEAASTPGMTARDRLEMILMGLGGYSPENYLGVLRSSGLSLDPDFVLLCFYVGNDVTGLPARGEVLHGQLYTVGSYDSRLNLLRRARLYLFLERQVLYRLRQARVRRREAEAADAGSARSPAPEPSRFYLKVLAERLPLYLKSPSRRVERLWNEAEGLLEEFDRECRAAGVPWGLVLIPDEIQVDGTLRARVLQELRRHGSRYDFQAPQRRLRDFAARHDLPVLDLLPVLRSAQAADSALYFPSDTHWNARGNRVAGRAVAGFLKERLRIRE